MVLIMEEETSRAHLDELLEHLLFGNVTKHDMLRVHWQDSESVRNAARLLLLLSLESFLKLFKLVGLLHELGMTSDLSDQSVARNDVALDDLTKTIEVVIIADLQCVTNSITRLLVALVDIYMNVVLIPELPGQRDSVHTLSRRPEEELSNRKQVEL